MGVRYTWAWIWWCQHLRVDLGVYTWSLPVSLDLNVHTWTLIWVSTWLWAMIWKSTCEPAKISECSHLFFPLSTCFARLSRGLSRSFITCFKPCHHVLTATTSVTEISTTRDNWLRSMTCVRQCLFIMNIKAKRPDTITRENNFNIFPFWLKHSHF